LKEKLSADKGKGKHMIHLKDMKPGEKGKVASIKLTGDSCKRIVEMGVTVGTLIMLEKVAPLGDPIDIKVKGYHLSLRKEDANGIELELI
jgi:Fe2+ transport system protein FeoA